MKQGKSAVAALSTVVVCLLSFVSIHIFLRSVPAFAQDASANPRVSLPIHFDVSPPLSELPHAAPSRQGPRTVHPVMLPKGQKQGGASIVQDGALQSSVEALVSANVGLNLAGVSINGPTLDCGAIIGFGLAPSDSNLAVGDTQVVQWVNICYAVFDKATGALVAGPIPGNAFWSGFGGPCETQNDGDIIAQWDKVAHRWLMAQNVFSSPYMTCVAVSTTADATGTYFRYAFPQPNGFPDYPKWGIWTDAYYQHNNVFGGPNGFGSEPCAYDRANMLKGSPKASQICFFAPTVFDDSMLPADIDSPSSPPSGGQPEMYLGSIDNTPPTSNVIYMYLFHVDFNNPPKSTFQGFGGTMPISVPTFTLACGGVGFADCVPQKSTSAKLEVIGDRLLYRLAYRNFGDHQAWVVTHDVTTATGQVGERWYEFRAPEGSTTPTVFQSGTFAGPPGDTMFRWMGSIAMDKAGDMALGYSISDRGVFPSINFTGRTPADPLGTMQSEATILNGTGSQTDTSGRWGDYSSMAVDAADGCTFWYTNQYYIDTGSFSWSSQLASIRFPTCK